MLMSSAEIAAFLVAVCFAAGLNVSGTVTLLGVLARLGVVDLPGGLDSLESWWVIGPAAALFLVELVADKIPLFDLVWNVLQTFIRVPVAGLIAYAALPELSPGWQLAAGALGSLLALVAHTLKSTIRTAVNTSPEPASNIAVSLGEDLLALGVVWFATQYPWLAAALVLFVLATGFLVVRWLFRRLRSLRRPRTAAAS
ncbi:MAG: hypothetical protein AMXMBFR57_12150 [Acidimicrobiia bacterium]